MDYRLLANVYVVRVTSTTAAKRSPLASFSLIVQRPHFGGGLLTILLDNTVQLIQCSTKEVAQNIIRLQYGPNGKQLVVRATSQNDRREWIDTITSSLQPPRTPYKCASTPCVGKQTYQTANCARVSTAVAAPPLSSLTLDAIKKLADGYDQLATQWTHVAKETRQFNVQIAQYAV